MLGGFNPFEKYACQIGSFPQVGVNIKSKLKPPPTWRIIPGIVSSDRITAIYKQWKGHLEGVPQPQVLGTYDHHGY